MWRALSTFDIPASLDESEEGRATPLLAPLTLMLYRMYERRLLREVMGERLPRHLGIILDGNRRFGRSLQLSDAREIYRLGARRLDDVLAWCRELEIPAITLWALSIDNLRRPGEELAGILSAIEEKIRALATDPEMRRRGVRIRAVGRLDLLPRRTRRVLDEAAEATRGGNAVTLTIAIAYGGRDEIADAVRAMLRERAERGETLDTVAEQVTPDAIGRHLYAVDLPEPELIIRTSGEIRLSGFLLWQSAYSELYFTDVNWPAFRKIDFLRAIRDFQSRHRRYGL